MEDWKKLNEENILKNQFVTFIKRSYEMPDKSIRDYFLARYKHGAVVFAITIDKKVVMTKEYRPGPEKWLLDLPAGGVEDAENAQFTAERELLEETGYKTPKLVFLGKYYIDAYMWGVNHCYLALDCERDAGYKLSEADTVGVMEISLEEFEKHMREGEMIHVATGMLALEYLKKNNLI